MNDRTRAILKTLFGLIVGLMGIVLTLLASGLEGSIGVLSQSLGIALIVTGAVTVFQESVLSPLRRDDFKYQISRISQQSQETVHNLRVFLCYASADQPRVENFYNALTEDGIDAWLDKRSLIPGQNWRVEIPKAVRNSHVVIVFLTHHSLTKEGFVQKEIKIALDTAEEKPDGTIFIIPARLEICEAPARLSEFQWVNLFEEDGYERLIKALQERARDLNIVISRRTQGYLK